MVLMNLFPGQEYRLRHKEQIYGHSKEKRGWDELRAALKYIHYHMQNRWPMGGCHITQRANQLLCDSLEGRDGVGGGRETQEGGNICILMAASC